MSTIKKNKDDHLRRQEAARQAEESERLTTLKRTAAVKKFRTELSHSTKPVLAYPAVLSGYHPEEWCELHLPDDTKVRGWATGEIRKRIPAALSNLVRWGFAWEMVVLPRASYEISDGIPSLRWNFIARVLVTANLELDECLIYEQHSLYSITIQGQGQKLGVFYLPADWSLDGDFYTPIVLLRALAEGQMEASGVSVIERTVPMTFFSVEGLEDDVGIHDSFRAFIRKMSEKKPLWDSLLNIGLIDTTTAQLLKQKWNQQHLPSSAGSPLGEVDKEAVVEKLTELGWAKDDAANIVQTLAIPSDASIDDLVKLAVEKHEASH